VISNGRPDGPADVAVDEPPAAAPASVAQAEIQLGLTAGQPLSCRGLQRLQLQLVVRRADMFDRARSPPRAVHDLHRDRPGRGLHRAHVRQDTAGYEIDLVRKSDRAHEQTRRSTPPSNPKINKLIKVRTLLAIT
jgi:hypothetical protein